MDQAIIDKIKQDFKTEDVPLVIDELSSVTLDHVMARSEYNLNNTHFSILKLAKGNIKEVQEFVKYAKIDFRDVIMWAMQQNK